MKAVIFDMDGVIFDSERLFIQYSQEIALKMGYKMDWEFGLSFVGVGQNIIAEKLLKKYGDDFDLLTFEKNVFERYKKGVVDQELVMKNGVFELLEYLKKEDYKIGLASSTQGELVVWQLEKYGLLKYFDHIIGGDDVCHNKPCPECYLSSLRFLEATPNETYVIEDSFDGVKAGFDADANVIMVPDLIEPNIQITKMCKFVAKDLLNVIDYLKNN